MNGIYGAPATGVPISEIEDRTIRVEGQNYSRGLMEKLLLELTPAELAMKAGDDPAGYDYAAFSSEKRIFAPGHIVHILRHLRYDRHKPHSHDFFEMICQTSGHAEAMIMGRKVELESGTICILSPNTMHKIESDSDNSITFKVIMQRTDFDAIYRQLLRSDTQLSAFFSSTLYSRDGGFLIFRAGGDEELIDLLYKMRYHEVRQAPTDAMMKQSLVIWLFCILAERHVASVESKGEDLAGRIISTMRADFRNVTLSNLAARLHFSSGYVARVLKRETGRSFSALIEEMKLNHAIGLLDATDMPVEEIAIESGFGCREFFHRKFKEKYGISPAKWRENARTEAKNSDSGEAENLLFKPEDELTSQPEIVTENDLGNAIAKSKKDIDVTLL